MHTEIFLQQNQTEMVLVLKWHKNIKCVCFGFLCAPIYALHLTWLIYGLTNICAGCHPFILEVVVSKGLVSDIINLRRFTMKAKSYNNWYKYVDWFGFIIRAYNWSWEIFSAHQVQPSTSFSNQYSIQYLWSTVFNAISTMKYVVSFFRKVWTFICSRAEYLQNLMYVITIVSCFYFLLWYFGVYLFIIVNVDQQLRNRPIEHMNSMP